jgi:hypothetical protein
MLFSPESGCVTIIAKYSGLPWYRMVDTTCASLKWWAST